MAFRVLDGDVREQESITYSALRHRATERARALVRNGAAGRNVVLFQPTGLDFVVSFFAVLATGGTVIPLNPRLLLRPADGLDGIVANARPALLLGDRTTAARLARAGYDNNALGLPVTDPTEYCTDQDTDTEMVPAAEPSAIAVIQYTSGSTSAPKGACITHANFLNNARLLTETFEAGPGDSTVSWLPLFHDMGLMTSVVWPVVTGATSVLLRPSTFAVNPASWLIALSKYGGTVSSAPNFAYQLCVDRIGGEDIANLNLSGWRVAICGAEPVRAETVERFVERFSAAGFARRSLFPSYGLAEATLFVSGGPRRNGPAILIVDAEAIEQQGLVRSPSSGVTTRRLVSCGAVGAGLEVLIMDAAGGELAEGEVGEIWLRGNSIGAGYLGQDALNAEVFRATPDPAYAPRTSGVGTFLRTGDLGFLADGELFIVGRLKDLIIVRGVKYAPQDLELTCSRRHPALEGMAGAAFALEDDRGVVIVHETRRGYGDQLEVIISAIRAGLAEVHGLAIDAVVLIPHRSLPITSSGKVRRQPTRQAWLAGELDTVASWRSDAPSATSVPNFAGAADD